MSKEGAEGTDPFRRLVRGLIRRMIVSLSGGPKSPLWQVVGVRTLDGGEETVIAEPFLGIGIYARPGPTGRPEAIVVNIGGANAPAVIAARDEKIRAAVAGSIKAGETMVFNAVAVIHLKDDGTVEICEPGGAGEPLVKRSEFLQHGHPFAATGAVSPTGGPVVGLAPAGLPATFPGTTVLKGQ